MVKHHTSPPKLVIPESRAADSSGIYFLHLRRAGPGLPQLRGYIRDDIVG